MPPSWLIGKATRDEVEAKVKPYEDGKFMVRKHDVAGQYVLCVVYRGKPTHHLMKKNADGNLTINGKQYTETDKVSVLVKFLSVKRPGWPVPLNKPCGGGGGGGGTPWLHGDISREDSESFLKASADCNGRFLIRTRDASTKEYVLSLVFKGKATQHLIKPNDEGVMTVNKKAYGNARDLEGLVAALGGNPPPSGWPLRLTEGVDTSGKIAKLGSGGGSVKKKKSSKKSSVKKSKKKSSSSGGTPWLHPKMSNDAAKALFEGKLVDGTFVIRKFDEKAHAYALTVVYKGKVTHHLMKAPPGSNSIVNKQDTGVVGLEATVEHLRAARREIKWPIALQDHIPNGDGGGAAAKAEADAAAAAKAAEELAKRKAAAEAEDNKVTGFYQLKNPFPAAQAGGDAGYMTVGAGSNVLAEARKLARETAANLSGDTKARYNVGMPLKVYGVGGQSSTDEYEPETYDFSDGTGTEPMHMSMMMRNPYVAPVGVAGTKVGLDKLAAVQKDVKVMVAKSATADSRINGLERAVETAHDALKAEVAELHSKNAHLEKKIGLLEQLLLNTGGSSAAAGDPSLINITEVRVIDKKKKFGVAQGGASTKPLKADLARASLLGKVRLLKDATFADCRHMINDDFDSAEVPKSFKFYTVEEGEAELLMVHEKQEPRTPVDASVVYLVKDRSARDDPRNRPHPYLD